MLKSPSPTYLVACILLLYVLYFTVSADEVLHSSELNKSHHMMMMIYPWQKNVSLLLNCGLPFHK